MAHYYLDAWVSITPKDGVGGIAMSKSYNRKTGEWFSVGGASNHPANFPEMGWSRHDEALNAFNTVKRPEHTKRVEILLSR